MPIGPVGARDGRRRTAFGSIENTLIRNDRFADLRHINPSLPRLRAREADAGKCPLMAPRPSFESSAGRAYYRPLWASGGSSRPSCRPGRRSASYRGPFRPRYRLTLCKAPRSPAHPRRAPQGSGGRAPQRTGSEADPRSDGVRAGAPREGLGRHRGLLVLRRRSTQGCWAGPDRVRTLFLRGADIGSLTRADAPPVRQCRTQTQGPPGLLRTEPKSSRRVGTDDGRHLPVFASSGTPRSTGFIRPPVGWSHRPVSAGERSGEWVSRAQPDRSDERGCRHRPSSRRGVRASGTPPVSRGPFE